MSDRLVDPGDPLPRLPGHSSDGRLERVLRSGRAERIDDAREVLTKSLELLHFEAENALLVPLVFRGRAVGVLAAYDRVGGERGFDREDERLGG
jgi:GAF domain-containing protein